MQATVRTEVRNKLHFSCISPCQPRAISKLRPDELFQDSTNYTLFFCQWRSSTIFPSNLFSLLKAVGSATIFILHIKPRPICNTTENEEA